MGVMTFRPGRRVVISAPGVQVWAPGVASAAFTGVLDGISSVAAAYSLRKLRSAYSGSAVRVRRSSDSTEQDIGFASDGEFDSSAFSSFVGGGTGYVKTWYDQSGSSRDATQATTGSQPQIALSALNAKAGIRTGSAGYLTATITVSASNWTLLCALIGPAVGGGGRYLMDITSGRIIFAARSGSSGSNPSVGFYTSSNSWNDIAAGTTVSQILSWKLQSGGSSARIYRDGAPLGSAVSYTQSAFGGATGIFAGPSGGAYIDTDVSELILLSAAIPAADHNTIGSNMATRYGLSWTTVT